MELTGTIGKILPGFGFLEVLGDILDMPTFADQLSII